MSYVRVFPTRMQRTKNMARRPSTAAPLQRWMIAAVWRTAPTAIWRTASTAIWRTASTATLRRLVANGRRRRSHTAATLHRLAAFGRPTPAALRRLAACGRRRRSPTPATLRRLPATLRRLAVNHRTAMPTLHDDCSCEPLHVQLAVQRIDPNRLGRPQATTELTRDLADACAVRGPALPCCQRPTW